MEHLIWSPSFLYKIACMHVCLAASVVFDSLPRCGLQPTGLLRLWDFPGKQTGLGCHAFLQGAFLTQGELMSPAVPTLWADLLPHIKHFEDYYLLSSSVMSNSLQPCGLQAARLLCSWTLQARILVAISFSRGSSHPRDGTQSSCIAGRFFTV